MDPEIKWGPGVSQSLDTISRKGFNGDLSGTTSREVISLIEGARLLHQRTAGRHLKLNAQEATSKSGSLVTSELGELVARSHLLAESGTTTDTKAPDWYDSQTSQQQHYRSKNQQGFLLLLKIAVLALVLIFAIVLKFGIYIYALLDAEVKCFNSERGNGHGVKSLHQKRALSEEPQPSTSSSL